MNAVSNRTSRIILLLLTLSMVLAAVLALSFWSNAKDVEIFNVYVGSESLVRSFAETHAAETGWTQGDGFATASDRTASFRHFYTESDLFSNAMAELNTSDSSKWLYKALRGSDDANVAEAYDWSDVRVNVWVLKDVETAATESGSQLFNVSNLVTKVGGRDLMVNLIGATGYGSAEKPVLTVRSKSSSGEFVSSTVAFSTKDLTVKFSRSTSMSLYMNNHEYIAYEGTAMQNSDGTTLFQLLGSGAHSAKAKNDHKCNGYGEYGSYHEDSFTCKITLFGGTWKYVTAASSDVFVAHTGVNIACVYDFSDSKRSDIYLTVDGADVEEINGFRSTSVSGNFIAGPNCALHYELKSGSIERFYGGSSGVASYTAATETAAVGDSTRQYYDLEVTSYDGVSVGTFALRPGVVNGNATSAPSVDFYFFGDITLNLFGGTFENGVTGVLCADRLNGGDHYFVLGQVKMVIGDADSHTGPTINGVCTPVNGATLGLSNTRDGAVLTAPIYKTDYTVPATNPTMGDWASSHAKADVEVHGGTLDSLGLTLAAQKSQGTSFTMTGGTLTDLYLNSADGSSTEALKGYTATMSGGSITTWTPFDPAAASGTPDAAHTVTGNVSLAMSGAAAIATVKGLQGTGTLTGDLCFTMSGDATVNRMEGILSAIQSGDAILKGDLIITLADNAAITDHVTFMNAPLVGSTKYYAKVGASASDKTCDVFLTVRDNARIEKTFTNGDTTSTKPEGLYLFGYRDNTTTYCYGDYTLDVLGGAIRAVNNNTAKGYSNIFLGGEDFRVYGDTAMSFKNGAAVEIARPAEGTASTASIIYFGGDNTYYLGAFTVNMEDCVFVTFNKSYLRTAKGSACYIGSAYFNLGSADGKKTPTVNLQGGDISLTNNYEKIGRGDTTKTLPTAVATNKTALSYNITGGDFGDGLFYTAPRDWYSASTLGWVEGNVSVNISGGSFGTLIINDTGYAFGDLICNVTGGSYDVINFYQCRGTATYTFDGAGITANTICNPGQINKASPELRTQRDAMETVDYAVVGDLEVTFRNFTKTTKLQPLAGDAFTGNITATYVSCNTQNGNATSATSDHFYTVQPGNGKALSGNLTANFRNCTMKDYSAIGYKGIVNGNVVNNFTDVSMTAGYFGACVDPVTLNGSITNNLTRSNTTHYLGGTSGGVITGGIVNNITDVSLAKSVNYGYFRCGNKITSKNVTGSISAGSAPAAITTTINGFTWAGEFTAGSQAADTNGDIVLNLISGSQPEHYYIFAGNEMTYTLDETHLIQGNVEINVSGGSWGTIYMGNKNAQTEMLTDTGNVIDGNVTLNINGGSVGTVCRNYNEGSLSYLSNISGAARVNISTEEADVTLKGAIPGLIAPGTTGGMEVSVTAGVHTLYKASGADVIAVTNLNATSGTPLIIARIDGADWEENDHLVIPGNETDLVQVVRGPCSTLAVEVQGETVIYSGVSYEFDLARSLILDSKFAVRYVLEKAKMDRFGAELEDLSISCLVNSEPYATLSFGDLQTMTIDGTAYYYFLVEGIRIKDFESTPIEVSVSMSGHDTALDDSVSLILENMASLHPTLSRSIRNYAQVIDAYVNQSAMPSISKTVPDAWVASHTVGETTRPVTFAPGISCVALNSMIDSGIVLNFWLKIDDLTTLTSATVNGTDVLSTLRDRTNEYYTVSYDCSAVDLRDLLILQVNGSDKKAFASPLSYAKKLALQEGCEDLAQATIEYAYYVSVLCGPTDDSPAPAMTPLAPTGTVDTVHANVRAYLERAQTTYVRGVDSDSVRTDVDLGNMNVPVIFSFKNDGDAVLIEPVLEISEDESFTSFRSVTVGSDARDGDTYTVSVDNLKTGTAYYWRVSVLVNGGRRVAGESGSFSTAKGPRVLTIDGVANGRDLGGWDTVDGKTVRQGLIYRTGKLDKATEKGLDVLVNELKIKTELDFRNPDLAADQPMNSPFKDSPNYINIATKSYSVSEQAKEKNARIMRVFADPSNYPIVFHCSAGADRTGAWAWMVKALCGVDEIDLICDYELTNYRYRIGTDQYPFPKLYNWFIDLPGDSMQEKTFTYFRDVCGMSEMELSNIIAILTTDSAVYTKPSAVPIPSQEGQITADITLRSTEGVDSVTTATGDALPFNFVDGILTVTVSGTEATSGTITFSDGTTLPLAWTVA